MNNILIKNMLTGSFAGLLFLFGGWMVAASGQGDPLPWTFDKTDKSESFAEALKTYDLWKSNPANLERKGWKAYGRWMEFNRSRLNPGGNPADPGIFITEALRIQKQKAAGERLKTGSGWSPVGPDQRPPDINTIPFSNSGMGRINCIAFHPTDPDIYWIGVAQGGVWKTVNGGESYTPLTDNLPILRISDIAVNPDNPDQIFIAVCDYDYAYYALMYRQLVTPIGIGVYKTMDGGLNWEPTGLTFDLTELDKTMIRRVLFHPTQPGVLLAGGVSGIFKSVDDGVTWSLVHKDIIWDIEQDFNNGNVIYATTGTIRNRTGNPASLIKSTDFGDSWTKLNTGWPNNLNIGRTEIGLTPESSDYVYVVAANPSGTFYGFYRSTDAGSTWEARNTQAQNGSNILDGTQGWYDLAILVDPRNKEHVFVGGITFQVSIDGGSSWTRSSIDNYGAADYSTIHVDQHQYKYNPVDKKYYACHDGGVARTDTVIPGLGSDGRWATRWEERSNGMIITSFYRIGLCEKFPGYVFGGAQDNSFFYNRNGNWTSFGGGDGMECLIDPENPDILYASVQYGELYRSDDGGYSYLPVNPSVGNEVGEWTTPMIQDPNNPGTIFTGFGNVWKSINKGDSWSKISNFPAQSGYRRPAEITAMAMYPGNSQTLYVAQGISYDSNVPFRMRVTHDGGGQWYTITEGLPDSLYFESIAVNGNDSLDAWVTFGGFLPGQKVYRTRDGGIHWTNMSGDLPNIPVNSVVHQEGYGDDVVYIGTDAGVYYYTEESGTWTLYSNFLPNVIISELEIHYASRKLYAATFGRGIWMTDLVQGASSLAQPEFINSSLEVYPNPSTGDFTIRLSGVQKDLVDLEVVSISGQTVYKEQLSVTGGSVQRKISPKLSPGLYFIRIWSNERHLTQKVLVR